MRVHDQSVSKKARYSSPVRHRPSPAHATRVTELQRLHHGSGGAATCCVLRRRAATHLQQRNTRQLAHTIPWTNLYVYVRGRP